MRKWHAIAMLAPLLLMTACSEPTLGAHVDDLRQLQKSYEKFSECRIPEKLSRSRQFEVIRCGNGDMLVHALDDDGKLGLDVATYDWRKAGLTTSGIAHGDNWAIASQEHWQEIADELGSDYSRSQEAPTGGQAYADLEELALAWSLVNSSDCGTLAAGDTSINCDDGAELIWFDSESNYSQSQSKELLDSFAVLGDRSISILEGPNWIITGDSSLLEAGQEFTGGQLQHLGA
ncbi:hypothetical protein [Arthrobacter rhombi]|uniref:hypothetical protein n=1 Tax=Arthrobacter rhombi TaxID=71253 RepID=UPI003FD6BEDF